MKGYPIKSAACPLQLHWADQFVNESERSVDDEDAATVAQMVLFYASLQLEIMFPPANFPLDQLEITASKDWLLASEGEIVQASMERDPQANGRLLQLSLYTVRLTDPSTLSFEESTELRMYAGPYIRCARERLHLLARQWFH
ncbi:hypothetical protein GC093_15470 [Paenibacillus sp. LMG 31456]|uniref:Uncharacterized protein n=1 Tax=Paenibacillus foliorum TaxID=2654974 RepID=A0A972GPS2_9BACL|nr:hypothetical protein [Paenibacillus foliorum]NOU94609.1 hypothetical protein [Paenibacillus foliorum]